MTTFTIFAGTNDGRLESSSAVYATARAGSGTLAANTTAGGLLIGQQLTLGIYYAFETFLEFDTSSIGAGATVSAATLSLDGSSDSSATDFTVEAWSRDWGGGTLTTGDYVAGASLSALTLLASFASSGYSAGYNAFTSEAGFPAAVNLTGFTRLLLASSRTNAGTTPTGDEYISFSSADNSGTSQDPKLVVIATLPIAGDAAITEAGDTVASAGTVAIAGAAAITEAGDTVASAVITDAPGTINVRYAGMWQEPTPWVKYNGAWVEPVATYVNDAGIWKRVQ